MSYEVILSPEAEGTLLSFDPPLVNAVESHLLKLADIDEPASRATVSARFADVGIHPVA